MQIQQLDINLIDIPDRFRSNPAEDIEPLMESIKARGLLQPIVVTKVDGKTQLVCGRRRLEAHFRLQAQDPKFLQISAVFLEDLGEMERRIVELEENIRRVDFSEIEKVKAVNEIHRLFKNKDPHWTMEATANYLGFKHRAWVSIMTTVAESVEKEPDGVAAQILNQTGTRGNIQHAYKAVKKEEQKKVEGALEKLLGQKAVEQVASGEHGAEQRAEEIIHRGDALSLIQSIPTESISLIHTDPPYGIDFDILEKGDTKDEMYKGDSLDTSTQLWSRLAPELYRVSAPDAFAVVWVSFVQMPMIRDFMIKAGWECMRKPFIWVKINGPWAAYAPARWFASAYDSALVFAKGQPILQQQGKPDFSVFPPLQPSQKTHPLERPTMMLVELIGRFIFAGQTVLDPFAGSGSTLMATLALKGNPIGFELDERFYGIAKANVVKALKGVS